MSKKGGNNEKNAQKYKSKGNRKPLKVLRGVATLISFLKNPSNRPINIFVLKKVFTLERLETPIHFRSYD